MFSSDGFFRMGIFSAVVSESMMKRSAKKDEQDSMPNSFFMLQWQKRHIPARNDRRIKEYARMDQERKIHGWQS